MHTDETFPIFPGPNKLVMSHCHLVAGPDSGVNVGFSSPFLDNNQSSCYPNPHSPPSGAGELSDSEHWVFISNGMGLCDPEEGIGTWHYEFEPTEWDGTCNDYVDLGHGWVLLNTVTGVLDNVGLNIYGCGYMHYFPVPPPAYRVSTPVPCVPGNGRFNLVSRHLGNTEDSEDWVAVVSPIGKTDVRFPERAWMRTLEVVEWGEADAIYITDDGGVLNSSLNPNVPAALAAPADVGSFTVGTHTMGSQMAVSGLSEGEVPPVVDISWTCQVNAQEPHFDALAGHDSYVADLSEWGINHRFLFHVDSANKMLRIAPAGRFQDAIHMPFDSTGMFQGYIPTLDTTLKGRISQNGADLEIDIGRVTVSSGTAVDVIVKAELLAPVR